MAQIVNQYHVQQLHFFLGKCFNYKAVIVWEKEEAATGAGTLLRSKYLLVILLNIKWLDDARLWQAIHLQYAVE